MVVLDPKTWPFSLADLPTPTYLVGGAVRDALLGRRVSHVDLDFVVPEGAVAVARAIAHRYGAGFVVLDGERQIARVVFPTMTVDFAQQEGATLEKDLGRRDFTVNAIAYGLHTQTFLDPLEGRQDLHQRVLRRVARKNLQDDPLRLLRAYRQAAQLDFTLDPQTQADIRELAPLLKLVAAERVQAELNQLLQLPQGPRWLGEALADGILSLWLPRASTQGLAQLHLMDEAWQILGDRLPGFQESAREGVSFAEGSPLPQGAPSGTVSSKSNRPSSLSSKSSVPDVGSSKSDGSSSVSSKSSVPDVGSSKSDVSRVAGSKSVTETLSWFALARLLCLVSPDPQTAEAELLTLKYSRVVMRAAVMALESLPLLHHPLGDRRSQFAFFQAVGPVFPTVVLGSLATGQSNRAIAPLIERFLDPCDPVAHPHPLVSGHTLMQSLGLSPGPKIGQLLQAIQQAQAEGAIVTATEALELAAQLLKS